MFKLEASKAKIAYQYMNIKLKLLKTTLNIRYNKTCLDFRIVPNFVPVSYTHLDVYKRQVFMNGVI